MLVSKEHLKSFRLSQQAPQYLPYKDQFFFLSLRTALTFFKIKGGVI